MQAQQLANDRTLQGVRVFIVEDETLVAMQLEDMLLDLGCDIVGMAMRVRRATEMIEPGLGVDVAILDVNIGGEKIYPVAELLRARGIRIIFATGYGRSGVEDAWQDCQVIQKPYTEAQVCSTLREALAH